MLIDKKRNGDLGPSIVALSKNDSNYCFVVGYVYRNSNEFYDIRNASLVRTDQLDCFGGIINSDLINVLRFDQSVEVHVRNVAFVTLLTADLKNTYINRVKAHE